MSNDANGSVAAANVVVILDEYDFPIMRLMYEQEQLEAMRSMLRELRHHENRRCCVKQKRN